MTPLGGGIYEYTLTTPGSYNWKAVVTGTWDSISSDNRSVGTANWAFSFSAGQEADLYVNAFAGTAMVEITTVPEPSTLALLGCGLAAGFLPPTPQAVRFARNFLAQAPPWRGFFLRPADLLAKQQEARLAKDQSGRR